MRKELLLWFEREGLLLYNATTVASEREEDEVKVTVKAPVLALSHANTDFRECLDPVLFGYPETSLEMMNLQDMHEFVLSWFERAVDAGMVRCFACNKELDMSNTRPWDVVFITSEIYCWLALHFDCKRYLSRELKGRNPFEITATPPEFFDMRLI